MVVFWFLLALVLLVLAIVLLRLDAKQRGGGAGRSRQAVPEADRAEEQPDDDDEDRPVAAPADDVDQTSENADESGVAEEPGVAEENVESDDPPTVPAPLESAEPTLLEPAEPTVESSPRLLDKVRALLPARRQNGRTVEPAEQAPDNPLADSPVVRWLEERAFEPTPTPAPEFRHGDFALGLSALGTVSHGMFRGRRAIMGVTGGRTVLAMRRDTASDVVLDLSRPDVDVEPGFHDAGEVGVLEARTSDYGRLDLVDWDRLVDALSEVPADVRRIWAEAEWVAATIDSDEDPSTWDDVVAALHSVADVLAPFPPIGGRARALPAEIDPGAPGAASGPDADPTVGMDGEVGTGTQSAQAPAERAAGKHDADPIDSAPKPDAPTGTETTDGPADTPNDGPDDSPDESHDSSLAPQPEPRRTGHLRLVPDRSGARDLTGQPVVADRGDTDIQAETEDQAERDDHAEHGDSAEPTPIEPDPFAEIMEPSSPVPARGDVASDHLAPRPPLSRPTRGTGQAYPEDASVPPLAAGAATGSAGIKPLGSDDPEDEDEIRGEVERFDAARIDGGSDLDAATTGRHGAVDDESNPGGQAGRLTVADLAARAGVTPSSGGRRRRAEPEDDDAPPAGRERPGIEPDVEQTATLRLPPDIRD